MSHQMRLAETEQDWAQRAAMHLKIELKRANITYEELADRLKKDGFSETKASIANKLASATMSAHFFLASMVAIGREAVALEDIRRVGIPHAVRSLEKKGNQ